jgi:hypothetical protein
LRFSGVEAALFDVFSEGDELIGREVGGDRSERWPRASAEVYTMADGPLYLLNASVPQVAAASSMIDLEERIAFSALNEETQDSRWTYTTILLAACLLTMLFVLVLVWQASSSASQSLAISKLTFDAVDRLSRVTPTPVPVVR